MLNIKINTSLLMSIHLSIIIPNFGKLVIKEETSLSMARRIKTF
jgi:hypothetical protein